MKSNHHIEDFLLDKSFKDWVLKGDSTQQAYWLKWQEDHPDKAPMLLQARIILLELNGPGSDWGVNRKDQVFSKINGQINSGRQGKKKEAIPSYYSSNSPVEKRVRAIIVIFLMLASFVAFLQMDFQDKDENDQVALGDRKSEWVVKSNPPGQKSTIHLPDGSSLVLNSESEIRFKSDFGKDQRDIFLKGESFFEVAHDSLLPFRVIVGDLITIALGTSFNINAYQEQKVQVQLASGKVKVYKEKEADQPFFLVPGEELLLGADHKLFKRNFDLNKAFLWKEGILKFENTPFSQLLLILERWYAVEIDVKNAPFQEKLVSGEFKNTYLSNVLESLGYAYGFGYKIRNKKVEISFNQKDDL